MLFLKKLAASVVFVLIVKYLLELLITDPYIVGYLVGMLVMEFLDVLDIIFRKENKVSDTVYKNKTNQATYLLLQEFEKESLVLREDVNTRMLIPKEELAKRYERL